MTLWRRRLSVSYNHVTPLTASRHHRLSLSNARPLAHLLGLCPFGVVFDGRRDRWLRQPLQHLPIRTGRIGATRQDDWDRHRGSVALLRTYTPYQAAMAKTCIIYQSSLSLYPSTLHTVFADQCQSRCLGDFAQPPFVCLLQGAWVLCRCFAKHLLAKAPGDRLSPRLCSRPARRTIRRGPLLRSKVTPPRG